MVQKWRDLLREQKTFANLLRLQELLSMELWRWCFFAAGFAPTWYLSTLLVHSALLLLEAKLFTIQQAFYFIVAIKVCNCQC